MVHRGTSRESRKLQVRSVSTAEQKLRRHRNKMRIWRRAVRRLEVLRVAELQAA